MQNLMTKNTLIAGLVLALAWSVSTPGTGQAEERPPLKGLLEGNFILLEEPVPAPQEASVGDVTGGRVRLPDFAGRVVLVNFWATWCAPCIREMPSLDRLQAKLGGEGLTVMAVSQDRKGLEKAAGFYEEAGLEHLGIFLDPKGEFARALGVTGLPTTFLVDTEGRMIGALQGPLEWDEPEAVELIRFYLNRRQDAAATGD